jgi:beta-1,4-mannosyltransferase
MGHFTLKPVVLIHPPHYSLDSENSFLDPLFNFSSPEIDIKSFSWRSALFTRYQIFHVHWIEHLVGSPGTVKSFSKAILALALLLRVLLFKIVVVNTRHNLRPHSEIMNPFSRLAFMLWTRNIQFHIVMNKYESLGPASNTFLIPHHMYKNRGSRIADLSEISDSRQEFYLHIGRMDENRKIVELIRSFGNTIADAELHLVGQVIDRDYLAKVLNEAEKYSNVYVKPQKVTLKELDCLIYRSSGIIGPLNDFHNSGVIFHVLSHKKMLLTIDNPTTREIQKEFSDSLLQIDSNPTSQTSLANFVNSCRISRSDSYEQNFSSDRDPITFFRTHVEVYKTINLQS